MTNNLLQLKFKQRLNKLASLDYDNFECWQIQEAFNKAQLEWVRRQLHGTNPYKEGAESSITRVDDLQVLLSEEFLSGGHYDSYFESELIPKDYMRFVKVTSKGQSDCCGERPIRIDLAEEANADSLLLDTNSKPSFEWAETFCTVIANRIRVYTNGEFTLVKPKLTYYRKPAEVLFVNCVNPNSGETSYKEALCEFKDDIVEVIIDEACAILAGDIESIGQMQRGTQNAERNN